MKKIALAACARFAFAAFTLSALCQQAQADHYYTTNVTGDLAQQSGYTQENFFTAYVFTTQAAGTTPMFRWFNPKSGDHFYTIDSSGEQAIQGGYGPRPETVAFYCYSSPQANTVPLHRLFIEGHGFHLLALDSEIEPAKRAGYRYEKPACHVFANQVEGTSPLYRWFSPDTNAPMKKGCTWQWVPGPSNALAFECK